MREPILEIDIHLPLDRFPLSVRFRSTGQVTGIFGPSGSGKTSLLESIAGLRSRVTGRIRVAGHTWLDSVNRIRLKVEHRGIGYVPQEGLLFPHLNVRENLLSGTRRPCHTGPAPAAENTGTLLREIVDLLQIRPLLDRRVQQLSGGERQRVALGRALCSRPELLVLDEPLASLDLRMRHSILPFLREIRSHFNIPMLLVSHDPSEVQALCDDLIVMNDGEITAQGTPRQVLTDPGILGASHEQQLNNVLFGHAMEPQDSEYSIAIPTQNGKPIRLYTAPFNALPGEQIIVSISSAEIIIAMEDAQRISARNLIPGRISRIKLSGERVFVMVGLGDGIPDLAAQITRKSASELGLEADTKVYLIIKAGSCHPFTAESA